VGKRMNYTDSILTAIAILLALHLLLNLGWLGTRSVHAAGTTPVQIVAVEAPLPVHIASPRVTLLGKGDALPVAIEAPLSISGSLCANPCR
jgi:hypothetical protein